MLKRTRIQIQSFNSGEAQILKYTESTITDTIGFPFDYREAVAGYKRRYAAETSGHNIKKVINVPADLSVEVNDLLEVRDYRSGKTEILKVTQAYLKPDQTPPVMQLTLERGTKAYADKRPSGQSLASL